MAKRNLYDVLGIQRNASADDVKAAYHRLIKEVHPDLNPGNKKAENKAKEIIAAYAVLGKPEAKRLYDVHGHPDNSLDDAVNRAWTQRSSHSKHRTSAYRTDWDMFVDELAKEWNYAHAFDAGLKNAQFKWMGYVDGLYKGLGVASPAILALGYYVGSQKGLNVAPYNWVFNEQTIKAFSEPSTEAGIVGAIFAVTPVVAAAGWSLVIKPMVDIYRGANAYNAGKDNKRLL